MIRAQVSFLPGGQRLHLHDGPIDLIIKADGDPLEIEKAYQAAADRFVTVLDELCSELSLLRLQFLPNGPRPKGAIARRMADAVTPFAEEVFITPMAAVAGAVAEEVLAAMLSAARLNKAYVNDGGDIALHLASEEVFLIGMIDRPDQPSLFGTVTIASAQPVRGIATSGWRGRSFSLGIADAVTVLAGRAAAADAAATIIANAVNLPMHPAILRVPAATLAPDSDLGTLLVTQQVGNLTEHEVETALQAGVVVAESLLSQKLIYAAAMRLRGEIRIVGLEPRSQVITAPSFPDTRRSSLHA